MLLCLLLVLPLLASASAPETGPVQRDHIEVELVAEQRSVQPGSRVRVGLRMLPDQNWHTYWVNPGDSGLPIRLDWTGPAGTTISEVHWPYPDRLPIGHLVNFGYEGEHLLPVTVEVPPDLSPGQDFVLDLYADWLVCKVECIPGDANLRLVLPVVDDEPASDPARKALFAWADARAPEVLSWPARFSTDGGQLSVQAETRRALPASGWDFFPATENLVDHAGETFIAVDEELIQISQPLSTYFTGAPETLPFVLVHSETGTALSLRAMPGDLSSPSAPLPAQASPNLALVLLMALAGGVLLNLMPCVFPVLSIKALSLASGGAHDQRGHGLAYTAGVVLSFAVLAGVLLALRAGGQSLGWGFQLQSPWFVGLLAYLFFAMGLGLSGVYTLGTSWMGVGENLSRQSGLRGSFFTGVLACVVASPCTAPFMGTALGVAIFLPWPLAMSVFLMLGLGLALPMLALSFWPGLGRRLPKPGPWMETFRQAMAFPLYLAAVWLLWVLARQTDANGLAMVLTGMVALAFALWLAGRPDRGELLATARHVAVALSLLLALAALGSAARLQPGSSVNEAGWWEPFSPERLEQLINDPDQAVLVNMTADWCVTCLVNERVALDTDAVRSALVEQDVVYLKGDWTRRDPIITEYLARFERNGVPLYVVYPRNGGQPRVLPQVLTPGLVVDALESL
ncbi:MAG: protein-disulfide reductase DsbD domain-containing protein [Wenzhouxiangella sp.]|nr:protein-disulfide reductase DsbD domain-containing protein [Wenzhouxiangella sp.]